MKQNRSYLRDGAWNSVSKQLLRWVDEDRGAELRNHIDDATVAGAPFAMSDAASVLHLASRTQAKRMLAQLPLFFAGIALAWLYLMTYQDISSGHWDVTVLYWPPRHRQAVESIWVVLVSLAVISGWRVAINIRRRRFALPALYGGSFAVFEFVGRDSLIEGKTYLFWTTVLAVSLPVIYLGADILASVSHRIKARTCSADVPTVRQRFDLAAVGAIMSPFLFFVSLRLTVLFLVLVWSAPTYRLYQKVLATTLYLVPLAAVEGVYSVTGIDIFEDISPGVTIPLVLALLFAFVLAWAWLAFTTFFPDRATSDGHIL